MEAAVRHVQGDSDMSSVRSLFREYAQWLKVDLCFQGFAKELATLPGAYAPPRGCLLLAAAPHEAPFGCIALRPLEREFHGAPWPAESSVSTSPPRVVGEVKRLYVQPARRGEGWGQRLAQAAIAEARAMGYTDLRLDTLGRMKEARSLYARLGFHECAPYYDNPLDDVVYMALAL